jgi:succinate dehydrogenase / fumarate reductase cytochrome b subunit
MSRSGYFFSTVGRKQMMALAGIGLSLFVLGHALGNLLMFVGPDAYNKYGHAIITNPLIYAVEVGLVSIFVLHAVAGIVLTIKNFKARPTNYAVHATGEKRTSVTTRTMWIQGLVLLGFVVLHLITFKYGPHYETVVAGVTMRDLFKLVYEVFQSPGYVTWYIFALLILCFHLAHGLYSSLQTMGAQHPRYTPMIKRVSVAYGFFVAAAFTSQPIYMHFFYKG